MMLRIAVWLLTFTLGSAEDWTQWRGPQRDGSISDGTFPRQWPPSLTKVWRLNAGEGHSSPLAVGETVFLLARFGEQETVSAYQLGDGKAVWRDEYPAPFTVNSYAGKHRKGPKSTPLWSEGRLFTLGISGVLTAYEASSGRRLWRLDYSHRTDTSNLFCGASMSPLMADGKLIVHVGDDRAGSLLALNPSDGQTFWSWDGDGPGYASPVKADFSGVPQIITLTRSKAVGVALEDGRLLWEIPFPDEWNENIVSPLVSGDRVILSGVRSGTFALHLRKSGKDWQTEEIWRNRSLPMYMSTPVLRGNRLFGFSSTRKGHLFCLDIEQGDPVWEADGRMGDNASVLLAPDAVLFLTTAGELLAVDPDADQYRPLTRYSVADSPVWAHPAVTRRGLVVKDTSHLTLWSFEP